MGTLCGPPAIARHSRHPNAWQGTRDLGTVAWGSAELPLDCPADFSADKPLLYTHRRLADQDIYFVSNQRPEELVTNVTFRVQNAVPELWWPDSGHKEQIGVYGTADATTCVPLHLPPQGSVFVVFRKIERQPNRDRSWSRRDGKEILDARPGSAADGPGRGQFRRPVSLDNFTLAVWAKPAADTTLLDEANTGAGR